MNAPIHEFPPSREPFTEQKWHGERFKTIQEIWPEKGEKIPDPSDYGAVRAVLFKTYICLCQTEHDKPLLNLYLSKLDYFSIHSKKKN